MTTTTKRPDELKPCPFCDQQPGFSCVEEKDERRFVQVRLECCVTMSEGLNFSQYSKMTAKKIEADLKSKLTERWNTRTPTNESPAPQATQEYARRLNDIATTCEIVGKNGEASDLRRIASVLASAPQPPVEGLRSATPIKQLDWQETFVDRGDGSAEQSGWEADNGFSSWYSVEQYFASDSYGWQVKFDCDVIGDFDNPDQAKVCAQSHFEIRILAALASPSLTAGPSSELRRAWLDKLNAIAPAVENLAGHQEQCDFDGVMVKVSRQALDEVLNAVNDLAVSFVTAPATLIEQSGQKDFEP